MLRKQLFTEDNFTIQSALHLTCFFSFFQILESSPLVFVTCSFKRLVLLHILLFLFFSLDIIVFVYKDEDIENTYICLNFLYTCRPYGYLAYISYINPFKKKYNQITDFRRQACYVEINMHQSFFFFLNLLWRPTCGKKNFTGIHT